ncbi:MAG TPA: hypothetical protein VE093_36230 [Polyangiaceae bacterium]|jgi:hypothetical protein|nr:hypothetical protein [Polyangiaceae bacterium]
MKPTEVTFPKLALAGLAFGAPMGVLFGLMTRSPGLGVVLGLLSAALFGLLIGAFARRVEQTDTFAPGGAAPDFLPEEHVIHQGLANHFKGMEGVGGKLYLTNRRLRFRSHAVNIQVHDESYPLDLITTVEPARTLGLIPNGLLVTLGDGRRERFVVHHRRAWVSAITEARRHLLAGRPYRGSPSPL